MDDAEREEAPMLLDTSSQVSNRRTDVELRRFRARSQSALVSMPPDSIDSYENQNQDPHYTGQSSRRTPFVPLSGPLYVMKPDNSIWPISGITSRTTPKTLALDFPTVNASDENYMPNDNASGRNEHLTKSGLLGMCNDPYCTTCPTYNKSKVSPSKNTKASPQFNSTSHGVLNGDYKAKGWVKRSLSFVNSGTMNPHNKVVQQWNKFFVISCLVAIFIDPSFFFLLSVKKERKCMVLDWHMATVFAVVRSITDFIYLLHMLLQFRLAYVAPESTVVGAGDLVDHPKKIAEHYFKGYFCLDLFVVLPLPQIMILFLIPNIVGSSANYAKNLLRATVLLQYIPRILRCLPLLAGRSANGFIFETAWANFFINLFIFVLAGHVVGSCWYLFGLQRVNQCLRNACKDFKEYCKFIDCGSNNNINDFSSEDNWAGWKNDANSTECFSKDGLFNYGIYQQVVNITTNHSVIVRYIYSLFWGFQQICTLAGNQVPSEFVWEVLFTMGIIGLGLFLFALLIGNMQNFLQALGRRRLEMQLRHRDVEQWMSHRRLPELLRRQVRQSERFAWSATRGANEEALLENLPEDLQREIRRHLFNFVKKIRIFAVMNDAIFDAICEKLRQKTYIQGSKVIYRGGLVDKMYFIVRGKLESVGADGNKASLSEGSVCGEELLTLWLENTSPNIDGRKISAHGHRLISNRTVKCLTNVEAFSLKASDLEEVNNLFARFLRDPFVQGAIRYESPYWREDAARRIQAAWRSRNKRLNRTNN